MKWSVRTFEWANKSVKTRLLMIHDQIVTLQCRIHSMIFTCLEWYIGLQTRICNIFAQCITKWRPLTRTGQVGGIFSLAVKIRDSQFIKWESEISCDQKNITFNWQTSAESQWSRSLYHPYHYPHHDHDQYHSRLAPAGHMLPCVLWMK